MVFRTRFHNLHWLIVSKVCIRNKCTKKNVPPHNSPSSVSGSHRFPSYFFNIFNCPCFQLFLFELAVPSLYYLIFWPTRSFRSKMVSISFSSIEFLLHFLNIFLFLPQHPFKLFSFLILWFLHNSFISISSSIYSSPLSIFSLSSHLPSWAISQ